MKAKRLFLMLFLLVLATSLAACKNDSEASAAKKDSKVYNLQVGHVVTTDHSYHLALEKFSKEVYEKSEGRLVVDIFPSAQLGNERDLVESLAMGTVDMALANSGNLASFTDAYQNFDFPFLFRDREHAHAVLDSEIGEKALSSLEKVDIKGLANWENGFFNTWNSKKSIEGPEDFKGMKIRANDNPIHIDSYKEIGASAITMGWSEVYTAIQNGTIDGVSVSIPSMYTARIYEVAPYISNSSEFYVTAVFMMNKDLFERLPKDLQQIISETAKETTKYQRDLNKEIEDKALADLASKGFEITNPNKDEMKKAVWDNIYNQYAPQLDKELIDSIQNDF
ncbi:DctP family TRAP transporter solute-binding subunit [Ureibacillus sp. GCM10028918]|uniref:DctP family TRAP transporter solute-binding subunit n=1 Tax=Ureibacillus sp. GCM10028918 TaxID=3273429 RepID=UPI003615153A